MTPTHNTIELIQALIDCYHSGEYADYQVLELIYGTLKNYYSDSVTREDYQNITNSPCI